MAEDLNITFSGVDEVSEVIDDLKEKIDELASEGSDEESQDTTITISADQAEPEIEQVMWDILDKIKTRAVQDEAEFLLNI